MFLSDVSIKRPVFATMLMVLLVTLGVVSFRRLAIDEYPDITYPTLVVQTTVPGASPESMVRDVSKPLEEALNTTQGIKEITSTSQQGSSVVRLQFQLGVNIMEAQQEVVSKVARIRRQLPPSADEPIVRRFDPNDRPIVGIAVQSDERSVRELTDIAEEIVSTRLEAIPGVGAVDLIGGNRRQIRVQLDPNALRAYGVTPPQVIAALQRENQDVPAGRIERGEVEQLVRISGRIIDPMAFADIAVTVRNGTAVKLRDVATVVDASEDRRSVAEINDTTMVALEILKLSGANTVQVSDSVRATIDVVKRQLPSDVELRVIRDESTRIRDSLHDVELTILLGALLTIGIIYLFLGSWRSTVITGLTLPVSIISAFFIMWVFGFTINTMTLMALSLAIGLLIDDAIVVRENIVRHVEMGKDHHAAARDGTDEIGLAVLSTTLAVVAVFVPVAFMGGMIGKIFFQFGVTVAFAMLVSLFVSFTLDPMLSSVWHDPEIAGAHGHGTTPTNPIKRFVFAFNQRFERMAERYPMALAWSLRRRWTVLAAAFASVLIALLIASRLGFGWMPEMDADDFQIGFRMPPGSALNHTVAKGREIAQLVRQHRDVEYAQLSVGGGSGGFGPNNGNVNVRLRPKAQRDKSLFEIQADLRRRLPAIPGVRPNIQGQRSIFGGYGRPITVNIQGPEPTRLKLAANRVLAVVQDVPGVTEAMSSDEGEIPQLDVRVDRQQAWRAGLGIATIASTLQPLFAGQRATRWEDPNGYSHDVVVVYPDSMRTSAADVADIPLAGTAIDSRTGTTTTIPLSQVADVRPGVGPQQIQRRNLEQQITVAANVLPGYALGDVANSAREAIEDIGLPPGYHAVFTGDVENMRETQGYVLEAIILAIVFIYLILASLFGSFIQPLSIMLSLPLSFIGVALALWATGGTLNVMTMIGIIMLMGLVTKNGILLVDFANQQRAAGIDRFDALLMSGRIRLRPIIMTTVAMIFGMLPLALAIGAGAEQRAPMARAVIGGLITSTLLTLFVVPVVYTLLDDLAGWVLGRRPRQEPAADPITSPPVPQGAGFGD